MDWMDFNRDGEVDGAEFMMGEEMLCSSRKEHELLFGDSENYDGNDYEDEEEEEEEEEEEDAFDDGDDFDSDDDFGDGDDEW